MKAAHIVPKRLGPSIVEYIFGAGSGSRLDTPDNCLIINKNVKRSFDNGNFVLLPADPSEPRIMTWKIQMTDSSATQADMGREILSDIDGRNLVFQNNNRPAARFLYYHFIMTLLINKRDRRSGWEKNLVELPSKKPFATPGRYMRNSMLLTLAKCAGDLDAAEARLLGEAGQETFEAGDHLGPSEEQEIGRRAFAAQVTDNGDNEDEKEQTGDEDGSDS